MVRRGMGEVFPPHFRERVRVTSSEQYGAHQVRGRRLSQHLESRISDKFTWVALEDEDDRFRSPRRIRCAKDRTMSVIPQAPDVPA